MNIIYKILVFLGIIKETKPKAKKEETIYMLKPLMTASGLWKKPIV